MSRGGLLLAALLGTAGPATAGDLLEAAASARAVVVGRAGPARAVDRHGRAATVSVERVLKGAVAGPLRVAWEEIAPRREPRLPEGRRALIVLDPMPGFSLWRSRFPSERPLVIAARGEAVLVDPAVQTIEALAGFLALEPGTRRGAAAVPALVDLVRAPDPRLAAAALARLDAMPGLEEALAGDEGKRLGAGVSKSDPERAAAILALASRRRLRALLPAAREASAAGGVLAAAGWSARAAIEGGLPPAEVEALLMAGDPPLRAVGARWLTGDARTERLRALGADPAGVVRAAALRALGGGATTGELAASLSDPDAEVVHEAVLGLRGRGEAAIEPLLAVVQAGREPARSRAVAVLGTIPEARPHLLDLAHEHPDEGVRGLARLALGRLETDPH